jgi:hypothetical protein
MKLTLLAMKYKLSALSILKKNQSPTAPDSPVITIRMRSEHWDGYMAFDFTKYSSVPTKLMLGCPERACTLERTARMDSAAAPNWRCHLSRAE